MYPVYLGSEQPRWTEDEQMINAEDEVNIDLRTSCTRDEAVIKICGWMHGPIHKIDRETDDPLGQILHFGEFKGSLSDALQKRRDAARQDFLDELNTNPDKVDKWQDKEFAVKRIDVLICDAMSHMLNIDAELAKGDDSTLKIDQIATEKTGVLHVTLNSLDKWTRSEYSISILDLDYEMQLREESPDQGALVPDDEDSDFDGGLSKTIAANLYTTLALLVESLCTSAGPALRNGNDPNALQVAKRISNLASNKLGEPLPGQSVENIRKRIAKALMVKRAKLADHR